MTVIRMADLRHPSYGASMDSFDDAHRRWFKVSSSTDLTYDFAQHLPPRLPVQNKAKRKQVGGAGKVHPPGPGTLG
jgi:hypothetical protein